jgi:hypothetical protein
MAMQSRSLIGIERLPGDTWTLLHLLAMLSAQLKMMQLNKVYTSLHNKRVGRFTRRPAFCDFDASFVQDDKLLYALWMADALMYK